MEKSPVKINFFGAFRKYGAYEMLHLPEDSDVSALKDSLARHMSLRIPAFSDSVLIRNATIACDDRIVGPHYKILPEHAISILPPVTLQWELG